MKKRLVYTVVSILMILAIVGLIWNSSLVNHNSEENKIVRLLGWVGYEEEDLVKEFEEQTGYTLKVKTFFGADKMFAMLSQEPSAYDVVVIDPEYIKKLYEAGLIQPIAEKTLDFSHYYEEFKHFEPCYIDNKLQTVIVRFGALGLVYNTDHVSADEISSFSKLLNPKFKNRLGMYDWYLPNMGLISLKQGNTAPYSISSSQFENLEQDLLQLKPQIRKVHGGVLSLLSSVESGDIWIVMAGGEWMTALLKPKNVPIDWIVPKEGGLIWFETLGLSSQAKNIKGAMELIRFLQSPKGQHLLMKRKAYNSLAPSRTAIQMLNEEERQLRHIQTDQAFHELVKKLTPRALPVHQSERDWQNVWNKFKSANPE